MYLSTYFSGIGSMLPHNKKVLGSNPQIGQGLSVWTLYVFLCSFLQQSKDMFGVRLIGDSELAVDASMNIFCFTVLAT